MTQFKKIKDSLHLAVSLLLLGSLLWAEESKELILDQVKIKALTQKAINTPIQPGVPGKVPFWNSRATNFIYAPAFEFSTVSGAKSYRFSVTAFGPKEWTIEVSNPKASLESVWKELNDGKNSIKLLYARNSKGKRVSARQKPQMIEKKAGAPASLLNFNDVPDATLYKFVVEGVKELSFEAEKPWASLVPIWNDIPLGRAILKVEGLDKKGGQVIGASKVTLGGRARKTYQAKTRVFERRAPFAGPYHEAAIDYIEAGTTWLRFFVKSDSRFQKWLKGEGDPKNLGGYPCKEEVSVIKGTCMLAKIETDSIKKEEYLTMARNAARTIIKGSFPDDWGLAGMPPTYGSHKEGKMTYRVVLTAYPARAGDAYLDLYALTKEKEFLDATLILAKQYKKFQLSNGTWDMLMDAKTGKKMDWCKSFVVPTLPMLLCKRLVEEFGFKEYQAVVDSTWKWISEDMIPQFRFEGQFEDTCSLGGRPWHISHHAAREISNYLIQNAKEDASYMPLAEEILRWQEDQFVFWEAPSMAQKIKFTPRMVEQHNGPLVYGAKGYTSDIGGQLEAWSTAYKATGNELYLAKALTMANAMVTLQKRMHHGNFINTYWGTGGGLDQWVNCHMMNIEYLIEFGEILKEKNLFVKINPDSGKDLPFFNKK